MDIVYTVESPWGALFATRDVAEHTARIWRAVYESKTWGEFRTAMPGAEWEEVIERLEDEIPADDTPFTYDDVPGWGDDGWYLGPWPPEDVLEWFPRDLIDEYGGEIEITPNGENLVLPADKAQQIANELRARGDRVEQTPNGDLSAWLHYAYGY